VSFIAVTGALELAVQRGELRTYQLKGGVALELRFPGTVRATRDLDVGLPGARVQRVDEFRAAIEGGYDRFAFRVRNEPRHLERADTVRVEVAITYDGRPFQTIDVDLGPADAPAEYVLPELPVLETLAIPVPQSVSCVAMSTQIAQKIHASTSPSIVNDPAQNRARDIVDVALLDSLGQIDNEALRDAAEALFASRAEHAWPPGVPEYPESWTSTITVLAEDLGFDDGAAAIVHRFRAVITRSLGVGP
jgi:hypothetical protein